MRSCEKPKCKEKLLTDINDLCQSCFLHKKINSVRKNMIRKYELLEQNNTAEFLENFLRGKIQLANQKIENMFNMENTSSSVYRENRVGILLSWKDCLKYYSDKLTKLNTPSSTQQPMPLLREKRVHINAIENEIDWLFSERIKQSDALTGDSLLDAIQVIDGVTYVYRRIDRRNKNALNNLAKRKLSEYLGSHPDNTLDLFQDVTIEKAKYNQTYYPNYKINNKEKEVYFALQRWIEAIEQLSPPTLKTSNVETPGIIKKFYKEEDFNNLIDEILEVDRIQVFNLLEHHFSIAAKPKSMGDSNWLTMLFKQLFHRFPQFDKVAENGETIAPAIRHPNIDMTYLWVQNQRSAIAKRVYERYNGVVKSDAEEKPSIPENPYPKIFVSYKGFQIFEAFKTEVVSEATEYADYSFLFSSLKKDELIHDLKHKTFIDFLGDTYKAKFAASYKQFKYSETVEKKKAYSRIKKQFQ